MTATTQRENYVGFVWEATGNATFTALKPIEDRHVVAQFPQWPSRMTEVISDRSADLEAARAALNEPGDRLSISDFRKELGI